MARGRRYSSRLTARIPAAAITLRVSRSSGPGGQHANTSSTRVEAVLELERADFLSAAEKGLVLARLGPVVRAVSQDERSQLRNRTLAIARLEAKLARALRVVPERKETKPPPAAVEGRLAEKRRRGELKDLRRPPAVED